ncbi:unnamed protein product [Cylindrotheca closterium]|uniref:Fe2OG dioxygenase domain-containing protein n=1 Tax=Cylindrotheca closterium TaxID=2856 RepID=A0AAD2G0C0_9STRA|nr:unnamed protein product [Cylindrotheca closterium]
MAKKRNKGKKRATKRLYDAARKAQKLDIISENGEPDTRAYQQNGRVEQEMKEEIAFNPDDADNANVDATASISDVDLEKTVRTLQVLTSTPQSIEMVRHSKRFKELRRFLHPLVVQQLKTYDKGIDYRHRTTVHLAHQEYGAALTSLQACADLEQIPKQGTIQRWVREVDSCEEGNLKISLLSRILTMGSKNQQDDSNCKTHNMIHPAQDLEDDYEGMNKHDPKLALLQAQQAQNQQPTQSKHQSDSTLAEPTGIDSCEWMIPDSLQNLLFERVKSLLPRTNIELQSRMGEESEVAKRKPCFELNSINKRWRFFRYGQGCVYRPHIDGSWPESKLVPRNKDDEENSTDHDDTINDSEGQQFCQRYKYDTDASGETRSFLTFLIYLNDGFEGGATRFYRPSNGSTGEMVAQGVEPKKGCVLVFPQGNTASLLHEGSAVTKGTKYVVRTDVLYRRKSTNH